MRLVLVPFVLFLVLQQFAVLRLTQSCRTHLLPVCHGPMLIDLDAHADASEPTAEPVVLTMLDNTEERWKLDDQVQPNATARGCRLCWPGDQQRWRVLAGPPVASLYRVHIVCVRGCSAA